MPALPDRLDLPGSPRSLGTHTAVSPYLSGQHVFLKTRRLNPVATEGSGFADTEEAWFWPLPKGACALEKHFELPSYRRNLRGRDVITRRFAVLIMVEEFVVRTHTD
ncbi:hypothetical protein NDU88_003861 [Pleurodeles waltl]|uniref:Uncharacterized protein n=1 Tax=Pleurodeles waltl TaxID=8319 RepID=A0AAV7M6K6_PLEWA|nr:hypothetical protein NDU88_003861 [Pleurodeles waltl]